MVCPTLFPTTTCNAKLWSVLHYSLLRVMLQYRPSCIIEAALSVLPQYCNTTVLYCLCTATVLQYYCAPLTYGVYVGVQVSQHGAAHQGRDAERVLRAGGPARRPGPLRHQDLLQGARLRLLPGQPPHLQRGHKGTTRITSCFLSLGRLSQMLLAYLTQGIDPCSLHI